MGKELTSAIMILIHTATQTPVGADLSRTPPIHRPSFPRDHTPFTNTHWSSTLQEGNP
ncbi:MAG TPA: hypothetical protein VN954_01865 [Ktedonobacteraceae bacterium]|nr:hypothetical protein [Ktedonobacteraceae bacterium]